MICTGTVIPEIVIKEDVPVVLSGQFVNAVKVKGFGSASIVSTE